MKAIYLKRQPSLEILNPEYYKIVEVDSEKVISLCINNGSIETEYEQEFYESVSFIKNTLDGETTEITKQDFDDEYKKVAVRINELASL